MSKREVKELSRTEATIRTNIDGTFPLDAVKTGCLQRIAASLEAIQQSLRFVLDRAHAFDQFIRTTKRSLRELRAAVRKSEQPKL